ncbi:MAG: cyclodeaminase/cyclohydrolase family protein, partial [Actinomycetota bacterium]
DAAIARGEFLEAADRDGAAFDRVMAAFRLPRTTDGERAARTAAIQDAYAGAAAVPLEVAALATDLLATAATSIAEGNRNAASDGLSAAELLAAAARSAAANVAINARSLRDRDRAASLDAAVAGLLARIDLGLRAARDAFAATATADA